MAEHFAKLHKILGPSLAQKIKKKQRRTGYLVEINRRIQATLYRMVKEVFSKGKSELRPE